MKKNILLFLLLTFIAMFILSCSSNPEESQDTSETTETIENTTPETTAQTDKNESKSPEYTDFPKKEIPKKENYDYYHVIKAPKGNPRDIVMDYMLKMAKIEWTPTTTWTTTWKGEAEFKVNLTYEAGKTYYGVPYSDTRAPLCEFERFVEDGKFTPNSTYYEELIGNHCSSSMNMAYQQIIDLSYPAGLRPTT